MKSHGLVNSPIRDSIIDPILEELDKRIREAVILTEETLSRSSPGKYRKLDYDEAL